MWKQNQDRNNLKTVLILAEAILFATIIIALANFLWKNTELGTFDIDLQVIFAAFFGLLIIMIASYIVSRSW